jgi:hypothetical protein
MALKFISIAELLRIKGDGGVSGDNTRKANEHAGLTVPLAPVQCSPLPLGGGERGELSITGGDGQSQYPCGFQATDPTAPTNPTCLQGTACPSSFDDIGQPINADMRIGAWHPLDLAQGCREFRTAMNSDEFYASPDDGPDAVAMPEPDGWNVELPSVPVDPMAWRVSAASYYDHHFSCPACIAAGRGLEYGMRCCTGLLLWDAYAEQLHGEAGCINQLQSVPLPI